MSLYSCASSSTDSSLPSPVFPTRKTSTPTDHSRSNSSRRKQGVSMGLNPLGVSPSDMIGKVLKRISRSQSHPTITFHFTDNTTYQVRVEGYNPMYPGIPKEIETDPGFGPILQQLESPGNATYTISHAKMVTLHDRAYELGKKESRWDQHHEAVAFKFAEEGRWHCIWVTLAEYERNSRRCIFRSFDDVYLDKLDRPGKKRRPGSRGGRSTGQWRNQ